MAKPNKPAVQTLKVKFLFANHDGICRTVEFPLDDTADSVKERLMEDWPTEVPPVKDAMRFRLLCMGKEMEMSSSKSLRSLHLPVHDMYPTPVNVSILPEDYVAPSSVKNAAKKGLPVNYNRCCVVQ